MKNNRLILALALIGLATVSLPADPAPAAVSPTGPVMEPGAGESEHLADKRYAEMLEKMQASIEEIAGLYGNPTFLQIFTNDPERAAQLKQRLRTDRREEALRGEMRDLEAKRDELRGDLALKEREAAKLAARLARQRSALDAISGALEAARKAVEDTAR
jgi:chromosome segregation ATPase